MANLPFQLPFGFGVPFGNVFNPGPLVNLPAAEAFFDQFIICGCGGFKDFKDWAIVINGKVYVAKWRDRPPRPPWTQQVWDLFVFDPPCGDCPTVPRGLGWFWCWDDVIATFRSEVRRSWVDQDYSPGGLTVVIGTNIFESSSFVFEKGPILWLKDQFEVDAGKVLSWKDSSGELYEAVAESALSAPQLVTVGDFQFARFTGSEWLNLNLRAIPKWHCFVVGKVQASLTNDIGAVISASGLVSPFSGFEAAISQTAIQAPLGALGTYIHPTWTFGSLTSPLNSVTLWEWSQNQTASKVGLNAVSQSVSQSPTLATDVWNPMVQNGVAPLPVLASVGRSNRPGEPRWFEGDIAEILVYPYLLDSGKRTQVLNYFRERYSLGAPIGLPNPV